MSVCKICSQDLVIELDPDEYGTTNLEYRRVCSRSAVSTRQLRLRLAEHQRQFQTIYAWLVSAIFTGMRIISSSILLLPLLPSLSGTSRQCLLDESPKVANTLACPSCNTLLAPQQPQILTQYHNEGGIQVDLDILPLIKEEAYLEANPAARPARAFMTMCGEGDVIGIVELLKAMDEDPDEDDMSTADLLRYQDPLDGMKTGLHSAIEKSQQESVWLLLWLASNFPTSSFPDEVIQAAEGMGAGRETAQGFDIRNLRDDQNRTAQDVAGTMGDMWAGLLVTGALTA